jgi:hypothetical protein
MAQTTVTRKYKGKAQGHVNWDAILRIFDALYGEKARSLPKYPAVIGAVHGKWIDSDNAQHEAASLEEIKDAYNKYKTASIIFSGSIDKRHYSFFQYWPSKAEAFVEVQAPDNTTADQLIGSVSKEFPYRERYVFISYDTSEYAMAAFIANVVQKRMVHGINVFVAKRDIPAGENPLKIMLEEQLLHAEALLALCSRQSKSSPWLWWESSAVWAKGGLVIPLFVDLSPNEFDGPITLVCQGLSFFDVTELNSALKSLIKKLCPGQKYEQLTKQEIAELQKFHEMYKNKNC